MNKLKNQDTIDSVFTQENLAGIIEVLNHLYPRETSRVKDTEYETVIAAAKADAHNNLIQNIMNFIVNK